MIDNLRPLTQEQRHADERAYRAVLAQWQAATAEPEKQSQWSQVCANALRDALSRANAPYNCRHILTRRSIR